MPMVLLCAQVLVLQAPHNGGPFEISKQSLPEIIQHYTRCISDSHSSRYSFQIPLCLLPELLRINMRIRVGKVARQIRR